MAQDRVWYAAYGSNLSADRFRAYLEGGTAPGSARIHRGARNPSAPLDERRHVCTHRRFYAGESRNWSGGGVAFLSSAAAEEKTPLRLYLLTWGQFEDVFAQENGAETRSLDHDDLIGAGHLDVGTGWYPRILQLGEGPDGLAICTITCVEPPQPVDVNPSEAYKATIDAGEKELESLLKWPNHLIG